MSAEASPTNEIPVVGHCDDRFGAVRDAFVANFSERGEVGAALTVIIKGETVIELAGGWSDASRTAPWRPDTLVNFYSAGKPLVALLLLQQIDQRGVSLDQPLCDFWPEFAAAGKSLATVRHALCHRAGVPAIRAELTNDDLWNWETMTRALAESAPWWEPGTAHAYHTNTYGHLIGECVRRVTGQLPGEVLATLASEVRADVHFGVPSSDLSRCAEVILDSPRVAATASAPITTPQVDDDVREMVMRGYFNPPGYSSFGVVNSREWRRAQIPSTNGHGTASALARIYSALLDEGRLLSPTLLASATSAQSEGFCPVLNEDTVFGLGFKPTSDHRRFGPNPRSYGHFGTGGALGFADPTAGVAVGYVMNHVIPRWQSSRNRALVDALYGAL